MTNPPDTTEIRNAYLSLVTASPTPIEFLYWLHGAFELRGAWQGDPQKYLPYDDYCEPFGYTLSRPETLLKIYLRVLQQYVHMETWPEHWKNDVGPAISWLFKAFTFNGSHVPQFNVNLLSEEEAFKPLSDHFIRTNVMTTLVDFINGHFEPHALTLDFTKPIPIEQQMPKNAFDWWLAGYGDLFSDTSQPWTPAVQKVIQLHAQSAGYDYIIQEHSAGLIRIQK